MITGVLRPDIWITRTEVVEVRVVRTLLSQGLLFVTQNGNFDGVLIWSSDGIQRALFESGWPIDLPGFRRPTRPNI